MINCKILSIKISLEKGQDRRTVQKGFLKVNHGLEGDAYAKPGDREVCLMSVKTLEKLSGFQDGLCVKRFVETICIDCEPEDIQVGDLLSLGDAQVAITKKGKRCFPECSLLKNKTKCPLMTEPMFGKVIKSGDIKVCD